MNNEPVAWIAYDEFGDFMLEATPEGDYPWQPLYTHPAKTLTDKDLDKLVKTAESLKHMEQYIVGLIDGFNHARAILRKAQEK